MEGSVVSMVLAGTLLVTCAHAFEVKCNAVEANVGNAANITCYVEKKDLSQEKVKFSVKFSVKTGDKVVHQRRNGVDDLQEQDAHFQHRTHLYEDGLKNGNITLRISNISEADEGNYTCSVTIDDEGNYITRTSSVTLVVVKSKGSGEERLDPEPTGSTSGAVIGGAVGAVGALVLIALTALVGVVIYKCKRGSGRSGENQAQPKNPEEHPMNPINEAQPAQPANN